MRSAILLFIALSIIGLGRDIGKEWKNDHDGSAGAQYSVVARNFLRYGPLGTKLAFVDQASHPPFFPILLAISFKLFGVHEAAARGVSTLFAIGFAVTFYLFLNRFFNDRVAFLSTLFLTLSPAYLVFGNLVSQEIPSLFFITLFFYHYFSWLHSSKRKNYGWMLVSFALATLTWWVGYFLIVLVLIQPWLFKRGKGPPIFPLLLIAGSVFFLHLIPLYFVGGWDEIRLLALRFIVRTGIAYKKITFDVGGWDFFSLEVFRVLYLATPFLLFFSTLWMVRFVQRWKRRPFSRGDEILVLLLIFGLIPLLVFRNLYYHHNYYLIYLLPFLASSSGLVLESAVQKKRALSVTLLFFLSGSVPVTLLLDRWDADPVLRVTRDEERPKDIGQWIAGNTALSDRILSNIGWWPQIDYYSDRPITHNVQRNDRLLEMTSERNLRYPYFLFYNRASYDRFLIRKLKENYALKSNYGENFFLYQLK